MASVPHKQLQQYVNYALLAIAGLLTLTVLAAWFASSQAVVTMDQEQLTKTSEDLLSYAAESKILAEQYADNRSTDNFTKIAATRLHESVSSLADQIEESDIDPADERQADKILEHATDLTDNLSDLSRLPDKDEAQAVVDNISRVKHILEKMP
jgi:hypothetical protein